MASHGFIQLPQALEHIAKVVVRLGVIGLDGQGLQEAGDGLIQFPQVLERSAQITVRLGVIWLDGDSLGDEINSGAVFSHLMGNHTKQM